MLDLFSPQAGSSLPWGQSLVFSILAHTPLMRTFILIFVSILCNSIVLAAPPPSKLSFLQFFVLALTETTFFIFRPSPIWFAGPCSSIAATRRLSTSFSSTIPTTSDSPKSWRPLWRRPHCSPIDRSPNFFCTCARLSWPARAHPSFSYTCALPRRRPFFDRP